MKARAAMGCTHATHKPTNGLAPVWLSAILPLSGLQYALVDNNVAEDTIANVLPGKAHADTR